MSNMSLQYDELNILLQKENSNLMEENHLLLESLNKIKTIVNRDLVASERLYAIRVVLNLTLEDYDNL